MAVVVYTADPSGLLRSIRAGILEGTIQTWSLDSDGDFTHSPQQWKLKAWLRPRIHSDRIVFSIFPPSKTTLGKETYAVYHGRFVEMLLAHFDVRFQNVVSTALPIEGDRVKSG